MSTLLKLLGIILFYTIIVTLFAIAVVPFIVIGALFWVIGVPITVKLGSVKKKYRWFSEVA